MPNSKSESKSPKSKSSQTSSSRPPEQEFSRNQVFSLINDLTAFQTEEKQHFTLLETIAEAYNVLKFVIEKHSYQSTVERLAKNGINISAGTLKQYMSRLNREREAETIQQHQPLDLTETVPLAAEEELTIPDEMFQKLIDYIDNNPDEINALNPDDSVEQERLHSLPNPASRQMRRTSRPLPLEAENVEVEIDSPITPDAAIAPATTAALHHPTAT